MKKILAISSPGGHWTQLQRIMPACLPHTIVYVSTLKGYENEVPNNIFYMVRDASRSNKISLVVLFFQLLKIMYVEKPNIVISTGAAPGLCAIIIAKLFGKKTIWVDSIANSKKLSASGIIAKYFTDLHLTQWKHLKTSKTQFFGTVL
jgi:UDP-N-acetylglucosamine:LPS N-acetylglucosamine transferase